MNIRITGASGYLGQIISEELQSHGHEVLPLDRPLLYGPAEALSARLSGCDAVIHLAGAPILQRWTNRNKKAILESRTVTTRNLAQAITLLSPDQRPWKVISASAIGIYRNGVTHDESSTDFDPGFAGTVVEAWEASWSKLPESTGLTIFRLAVVLGRQSATIKKLLLPFRLGLGGTIGHGRQPFPFVHEKDVAEAFLWAIETESITGTYNLTAPQQITNTGFTRALARKLRRPAILLIPPVALKLLYGQAATMLTRSPAAVPQKLQKAGFQFRYPTIGKALDEII